MSNSVIGQPRRPELHEKLVALASHLAQRREAILAAWRRAIVADATLTTGQSLPRAQLHDHIPALLENFERGLRASKIAESARSEIDQQGDAQAHGLHRWQQGFDLGEVSRELGRLNECMVYELDAYSSDDPRSTLSAMAEARRLWAELFGVAISSSTSQYFKLQQLESAGQVADLEDALASVRDLEQQRAELWQQAAHDLRGNVSVVAVATAGLNSTQATTEARSRLLSALDLNVRALARMLEDVTALARLQGGQEVRNVAPFDVAPLLRDLCDGMQPMAQQRGLFLDVTGLQTFTVEGDATKIRRVVQNLILNAIKYTRHGGVSVSCGTSEQGDHGRWFVEVADTGPGFHTGPGAPIAGALEVATEHAKDAESDAASGQVTHAPLVEGAIEPAPADPRPVHQQPGEGIGLSIVKRLCELLNATLEVSSKRGEGTSFKVLIPKTYRDS